MTIRVPAAAAGSYLPFELERWQSDWELAVEINLADSGVAPVALGELLGDGLDGVLEHPLHYPEVNGTRALRERIAAQYQDCAAENVLVTVGAAEANALVAQTLLEAGGAAVVMRPGYQQISGLAHNLGAEVHAFPLLVDDGWRADLDALDTAAGPQTALISINTPNNPTGTVLSEDQLDAVAAIAERSGGWLHSDEVYRGSELDGPEAPTAWGRLERAIVVGSLSKSYGLSGLRIGWVVAPQAMIEALWRRHEYATIAAASLSMLLAERALTEPLRTRLLDRQKELARRGRALVMDWARANAELVALEPPASTALAFPRLRRHPDSVAAATAIRERASVLVAPGAHLGADGHLRISHALAPDRTAEALERIAGVLRG